MIRRLQATPGNLPTRLVHLIPTMAIGDVAGLRDVHLLRDACLGFAWDVAVPTLESIDDGEQWVEQACDALLRSLQEDCTLEFQIDRGNDIEAVMQQYARRSPAAQGSLSRRLAECVMARWRGARREGFLPEDSSLNFWPRTQQIRLFLKSAPSRLLSGNQLSSLLAFSATRLERKLEEDLHHIGMQFRQQVRQIEQTATEAGLTLEAMTADDYIEWVGSLLFPQRTQTHAPRAAFTGFESPGETIAQFGDIVRVDQGEFVTEVRGERCWHRAVAMAWQGTVGPGMLAPITDHEHGVTVCLSYQASSRVKALFSLKTGQHINRKSALPFNEVEVEEKDESFAEAQRRMFAGENPGGARLVVWVRGGSDDETADRAHRILSVLDRYMPAEIERRIGSSLLFSCLPGGRTTTVDRAQCRSRRMMSADAAAMIPLAGYWQGTDAERSLALYPTRWGTPLFLDPRVCDRNPHFLVVGGSGSGKSFWVHDYLLQLHRLPDVWSCLLSIKPDYERLARLLGQSVTLGLDGEHSINPFAGAPTHENAAIWVAVLGLMLTDGQERLAIDKEVEGLLTECAMSAAHLNWDSRAGRPLRENRLDHIVERLERTPRGRDLVVRLRPYVAGPYSRLFNRASSLDINSSFIFFNLSNVVNLPCAAAVSLCLFGYVNAIMLDPERLGQQKVLGLDEGWALMRDRSSAELVEKAFRAYRSCNGMAFAVSQLLSDFDTPLGRAVLANTATKFILPQEPSSLAELPRYLELSDKERELIASLELRKGRYGEFLVKSQGLPSTVGRVLPDPLKYAIATTDPTDSARLAELQRACGGDLAAAVEVFAQRHPYGRNS